jgi:hypothetical protein
MVLADPVYEVQKYFDPLWYGIVCSTVVSGGWWSCAVFASFLVKSNVLNHDD